MSEGNSTKTKRVCEFPGCGRPARAKNQCDYHCRLRNAGLDLRPLRIRRGGGSLPRIICDEVYCQNHDLFGSCHVFRGLKTKKGYGQVSLNGKLVSVHRYWWEREIGPIPEGMVIDHMCRNRACCNVDHLRIVTNKINALENSVGASAKNSSKTHCPRGHAFDESSLKIYAGGPRRVCQICDHERNILKARAKKLARQKRKAITSPLDKTPKSE